MDCTCGDDGYKCCGPVYIQVCTVVVGGCGGGDLVSVQFVSPIANMNTKSFIQDLGDTTCTSNVV